jgi:hypothetical protein
VRTVLGCPKASAFLVSGYVMGRMISFGRPRLGSLLFVKILKGTFALVHALVRGIPSLRPVTDGLQCQRCAR